MAAAAVVVATATSVVFGFLGGSVSSPHRAIGFNSNCGVVPCSCVHYFLKKKKEFCSDYIFFSQLFFTHNSSIDRSQQ